MNPANVTRIELTFTGDAYYLCDGMPGRGIKIGPKHSPSNTDCSACPRFVKCPLSHVAAGATEITDLATLEAACKELGLEFVKGQTTYKWFGNWVNDYHGEDAAYKQGIDPKDYGKCAHVIKVPGAEYEIGVMKLPNGNYSIVYDFYGPGRKIMTTLGKGCEKLFQHYGLCKAQMLARAKGFMTQRKVQKTSHNVEGLGLNPDIKLVVTGNL